MFFHCEAVICDLNQTDGICKRQCPPPPLMARNTKKGTALIRLLLRVLGS